MSKVGFENISHLFFDLDDTLWDFEGNAFVAHQILYKKYDLGRWFRHFDHYFSIYSPKNIELWQKYARGEVTKPFLSIERFAFPLRQVAAPEAFACDMSEDFLAFTTEQNRLVPHALEVLEILAKKYSLSVISNGFCELQHKKMRNSGLSPFFDHVILSEDVGVLKPNHEIYDFALKMNQISPENAVMIGDNYESDICGAQNVGIGTILFNPHQKAVPAEVFQISSLRELLDIFA